jgi:polyisoprenoid-binding protein YceI
MKHIVLKIIALSVLTASVARAQSFTLTSASTMPLRLSVRSDSRLWLEGSSNVRDWRCDATAVDASVDIDDVSRTPVNSIARLRRVHVRVPTHSLTCGRSQMDRIMYKALHVDDEPDCRQIVGHFEVVSPGADGAVVMQGTLRIAGRERAVRVPVAVQQQPDGSLRAQGVLPILMTDYGVTPPTALFGVLRTGNRLVVKFDLVVDQPTAVASFGGER